MDPTLNPGTLDPLPSVLQHGLIAVSAFGLLSFLCSTALLLYLSYKLFSWWWRGDLDNGCNQFLLLIYNLVLADIQQSFAFVLTLVWLGEDKIDAQSVTCFVEGWFISTGDLASGVWIFAIALHTFYAVIKGNRLPTAVFTASVAGLWVFIYAMAVIGVALHPHNFYVRAGAWVMHPFDLITAVLTCHSAGSTKSMARSACGCTTSGSSFACSERFSSTFSSTSHYDPEYWFSLWIPLVALRHCQQEEMTRAHFEELEDTWSYIQSYIPYVRCH